MIYKTGYTKRVLTTTERREKKFPLSLGTKLGQQKKVERITEREKKIETKVEKIVGIKIKRRKKKKMSEKRRDKHPKATEKSRKK